MKGKSLIFKKPIILLFGKNRLGKTTTLCAIEWCLFGDIGHMKWLESSAKVKDEIINIFNKNGVAKVKGYVQKFIAKKEALM